METSMLATAVFPQFTKRRLSNVKIVLCENSVWHCVAQECGSLFRKAIIFPVLRSDASYRYANIDFPIPEVKIGHITLKIEFVPYFTSTR
jgi:hypothetical protein